MAIVSGLVITIVSLPDMIAKLHHDSVRQSHVCIIDIVCHCVLTRVTHVVVCMVSVTHVRYGYVSRSVVMVV